MAVDRPDPYLKFARDAGPLAPGSYRVVASDPWGATNDFGDLESAQAHADDVASEADYESVPPAAYIYDSNFVRVDEGMNYALRAKQKAAGASGLAAKLRKGLDRIRGGH